jgi:hypothetical protein
MFVSALDSQDRRCPRPEGGQTPGVDVGKGVSPQGSARRSHEAAWRFRQEQP